MESRMTEKEQELQQKLDLLQMDLDKVNNELKVLKAEKNALMNTLELCNSLQKQATGANNG